MRALVVILAALIGCGADEKTFPLEPTDPIRALYVAATTRALNGFVSAPFVYSKHQDGTKDRMGEGLLWGMVLLSALPCKEGGGISSGLTDLVTSQGGELVRFLPLGGYAGGRETNFDEETGYYFGVAARVRNCPLEEDALKRAWISRLDYIARQNGKLHANVDESMPAEFTFTRDAISHRFGVRAAPYKDRLRVLEQEIAAWALGVRVALAPAYRVHLGLRHFMALEALGYEISAHARGLYCSYTEAMDIPLVDWWCGRGGLEDYIANYQPNEWEFRMQRAGAWESPDGNGLETPGVDFIEALATAYDLR